VVGLEWYPCCRLKPATRCYDWELMRHLTYSPRLAPGQFSHSLDAYVVLHTHARARAHTHTHTHGQESVGNLGQIVAGKIEIPCS